MAFNPTLKFVPPQHGLRRRGV